jgi:hypothetical protein
LLAVSEVAIEEEVQSHGDVEFLIVDPFLKGEHRSVVNFESTLGVLQQSCHLMVQLAEGSEKRSVLVDGYGI